MLQDLNDNNFDGYTSDCSLETKLNIIESTYKTFKTHHGSGINEFHIPHGLNHVILTNIIGKLLNDEDVYGNLSDSDRDKYSSILGG